MAEWVNMVVAVATDTLVVASGGVGVVLDLASKSAGFDKSGWFTVAGIAIAALIAAYRVGYRRGVTFQSVAPPMTLHEAALHIRDRSAWGRKKRDELHLWRLVEDAIAEEINRAAFGDQIHPEGRLPKSPKMELIDRGYWRFCGIDELRLWDERNQMGTFLRGAGDPSIRVQAYYDVIIPRAEVLRVWPTLPQPLRAISDMLFRLKAWRRGWLGEIDQPRYVVRGHGLMYDNTDF